MKTTTINKKILAISAILFSSFAFMTGASAQSYNSNEYNNDTVSYANAGPTGATAYYSNSTDYNSNNYQNNNNNCNRWQNCGTGNLNGFNNHRFNSFNFINRFNNGNWNNRWHNNWRDCD